LAQSSHATRSRCLCRLDSTPSLSARLLGSALDSAARLGRSTCHSARLFGSASVRLGGSAAHRRMARRPSSSPAHGSAARWLGSAHSAAQRHGGNQRHGGSTPSRREARRRSCAAPPLLAAASHLLSLLAAPPPEPPPRPTRCAPPLVSASPSASPPPRNARLATSASASDHRPAAASRSRPLRST